MRMLFHNWIPPPIMITNEKLNTYPPLFSNSPPQRRGGLFAFCLMIRSPNFTTSPYWRIPLDFSDFSSNYPLLTSLLWLILKFIVI